MSQKNLMNQNGVAMFLVLWVMALLTVIVGEFCYAMRTELRMTTNFRESIQSYYTARAGIYLAINELLEVLLNPGRSFKADVDAPPSWRLNEPGPEISFGQGSFYARIVNENGRVNINQVGKGLLDILIRGLEVEDDQRNVIVDSILDWRDRDDHHELHGAENAYYRRLDPPRSAKNGNLDHIHELSEIRGITPEIFRMLSPIFTIYPRAEGPSATAAPAADGPESGAVDYNRVNLNAADAALLRLLPGMTNELAEELVRARQNLPFQVLTDVVPIVGDTVFQQLSPWVTLQRSPYYTVEAVARNEAGQVEHTLRACVKIDLRTESRYEIIHWEDDVIESFETDGGATQ